MSSAATTALPQDVLSKLQLLKDKLGADDLDAALDKSLDIANFVADTVNNPDSRLLVERDGKFTELKGIA